MTAIGAHTCGEPLATTERLPASAAPPGLFGFQGFKGFHRHAHERLRSYRLHTFNKNSLGHVTAVAAFATTASINFFSVIALKGFGDDSIILSNITLLLASQLSSAMIFPFLKMFCMYGPHCTRKPCRRSAGSPQRARLFSCISMY